MAPEMFDDRGRIEAAVGWRARTREQLQEALDLLVEIHERCPISLERVMVEKAIKDARAALRECDLNLGIGRRRLEALDGA